jgi:hypothetical protein
MFPGFSHPFTCVIAGPTQSGKTIFLRKLLKAVHLYIEPPPENITWCYGVYDEDQIETIKNGTKAKIDFVEGIPNLSDFSFSEPHLIICDDLMSDVGKSREVADLFTKGCHHKNISVILILQNVFHKAPFMRDIQTNSNYLVLFNNPRDCAQIVFIERQCFPQWKKYVVQSYHHACSRPHGYLLIDLKQNTPTNRRLMSGIFPPECFFYYDPVKK